MRSLDLDERVGSLPQAGADPLRWYACYTRARHEKQVDLLLRQRGVESFLPLVPRLRQWKDRKKRVLFVMFPSYVFARCPPAQLHQLAAVPGITSVVRSNGAPIAVPDEEIENVRRFAEALGNTDFEASLVTLPEEGEDVRITAGPFRGVSGRVVERRGRHRILVGLEAVGYGLEVDVDASVLESLALG